MDNPDIAVRLDQQQAKLHDLESKVEILIDSLVAFQTVWAFQTHAPERFQQLSPDEVIQMLIDLRRQAKSHGELQDAIRRKLNPPEPPPHSGN
jgi:hypothetical protein